MNFFVNIGPDLAKNIPSSCKEMESFLGQPRATSMVLMQTDEYAVTHLINSLKNNSSPGIDNIPISVIKFSCSFIASPLAKLINCSMSKGIFPNRLKMAKVVPIFKSGDSKLISNYRPISVLNIFSKIFEKVIGKRLTGYLTKNDFFFNNQLVLDKVTHSTSSALISFNEFVTNSQIHDATPTSGVAK